MPSYRLLRSNKESGPYALNDLVALGLKPYDLVWVDGRSAAWRYPSEITELKEYAPAVEEQPYDRFYKKPSETESPIKEPAAPTNSEKTYQQPAINETFAKEPARNIFEKPVENIEVKKTTPEIAKPVQLPEPKKKVFVSMPETNEFEVYRETHKANHYDQPQYEQYLPKPKPEAVKQKPIEEGTYSPISVQESEESRLETKYTQSLDDIKEMYINTLVQRKTKNKRKEILKKLRPVLIPVMLLAAGFAIGYVIKTQKRPLQASQTVSTVVPQQTVPEQKKEEMSPDGKDSNTTPAEQNQQQPSAQLNEVQSTHKADDNKNRKGLDEQDKTLNGQEQVLVQSQRKNKNIESTAPKAVFPENNEKGAIAPDDETASVQKKNVEVDPNTGERNKVVRDNDNDHDASSENNSRTNSTSSTRKKSKTEPNFIETDNHKDLRDLVTVQSNNYIRGAFGGIRGLELTVSNNSDYLVDEVSVELQIMKPSEQPLRTDIITFKNIGSNKSITVKVPDSQRGIRVDYRITNIESRQFEKGTAGL